MTANSSVATTSSMTASMRPIRPPNRLKIVALLTPAALATSSSGTVRPRPWKAPIAAERICWELRLASARRPDSEGTAAAKTLTVVNL